ncbi:uncharacterized protein METZ01_LOCUS349894, partial [marine metagenome]
MNSKQDLNNICRIADALERLSPAPHKKPDLKGADAFVWNAEQNRLNPALQVSRV